MRGLNWLISLYENGINGILADEMVCAFVILCILRFNPRIGIREDFADDRFIGLHD